MFAPTRWSLVQRAANVDPAAATRALAELCEQYWSPLYGFLRRQGHAADRALELVQSFCVELLENGRVGGADPRQGRFRGYLLGALQHFVANERRREQAQQRGGGRVAWSLDGAEAAYAVFAASVRSPEQEFERRWAEALLDRAKARLRDEYVGKGRGGLFAALEPALAGEAKANHAEVAARLGATEGAVKVALHRLRGRLGELIRDEVLQTVGEPAEVDAEIQHLRNAVAAPDSAANR